MGGPSKSTINTQNQLTQSQIDLASKEFDTSQSDQAQRQQLMQPAIDQLKSIISGDKGAAFAAVAPSISQFSQAGKQAKGQILESTGPGVARDVALANNDINTRTGIASTLSNAFSTAFDKLANIGSGLGSFSLNEAGAALSG